MKILHIGKYFHPAHGGIESFLMDLTRESARQGVRQGVLVHAQPGAPDGPGGSGGPENHAGFPFLDYFERVACYGSLGYAPISPAFGARLGAAVRQFQPDLLALHLPNPSAFWALLSPAARRIPWLVHWHADASGPEFEPVVRMLYPLYRPFEQALLARAARVIVTSPPYLQASRALRRWQARCRVVPLGLARERLEKRQACRISPGWDGGTRLRLLAVGRLTPYKGLDVLIRAMVRTRAELVIVGDGPERSRLERLIAELGLAGRVHRVGGASDAIRNELLSQCDLLCLPSLNRAEAFGISVLEAMAMGKPALVSQLPGSGLPWLVQDGRTGWHAPPGDADALAACINRLDDDRAGVAACGARAAVRYREHFDLHRVTGQIIALQQQVLGTHRHRPG